MQLKKALVTGGAGFIGSHLVDALTESGYSVKVVDNLSSGSLDNIAQHLGGEHFEFLKGDLKDPAVARRSVEDVELIFHLAANPDVRLGEAAPSVHFSENLLVTFNILEAMRLSRRAKRIIFASTSTVYGEAEVFPTREDYGPLLPISVYGAAKLGCEGLIASYCHTFSLSGVSLRFANVVGARAKHGVIIDFIKKLRENPEELEILGDGNQRKSYLHVKDLVSAFFTVLPCLEKASRAEVFNVGSLDWVSVKRIAEIVCEEMNLNPKFRFIDVVGDGRGWRGDVKLMRLSVDKLISLGWKPTLNSEEAVRLGCRENLRMQQN